MASMKPKKSSLPPPRPRESVVIGAPKRSVDGRVIVGVILAAVVVVGIVVALLAGGSDDNGDSAEPPSIDDIVKPVTVDGPALAPFTQEMITGSEADPAIGDVAPVVSGVDYDGDPITIDAATDGPTMVALVAHWCPHCNAEIPRLNEWRDAGDVPDGLNVVAVSTGVSPDRANYPPDQWLADKDWQWPVLADSRENTALRAYGGEYFPTVVIIGSDGRVLTRFSGEPSVDQIDELVDAALAADGGNG